MALLKMHNRSAQYSVVSPSSSTETLLHRPNTIQPNRWINYCVLTINGLLCLLGLATSGFAGSTLANATPNGPDHVYTLNPKVLPALVGPDSNEILEFPQSFNLFSTQIVLAAGIGTMVYASFIFTPVLVGTLHVSKSITTTLPNPRRYLYILLILTSFLTLFTTLTSICSWATHASLLPIKFTRLTVLDRRYQYTSPTPEAWFQQLSQAILDADSQTDLRNRYLFAAVARYLTVPVAVVQICSLAGLVVLKREVRLGGVRDVVVAKGFHGKGGGSFGAGESDVEVGGTGESLMGDGDEVTVELQRR